jgi:hypothetical protein
MSESLSPRSMGRYGRLPLELSETSAGAAATFVVKIFVDTNIHV